MNDGSQASAAAPAPRGRARLLIAGATIAVAVVAATAAALYLRGGDDGPGQPPLSRIETPVDRTTPTPLPQPSHPQFDAFAPAEIIPETQVLMSEVLALNQAEADLFLMLSASDVTALDVGAAQQAVIAHALRVGVHADLLADATARGPGQHAADTAALYTDVGRAAYAVSYLAASYEPEELLARPAGSARAIATAWSWLQVASPDVAEAFALAPVDVSWETVRGESRGTDGPDMLVSSVARRYTLRLDGPRELVPEGQSGDVTLLQRAMDPGAGLTLDELRGVVAARVALHSEQDRAVSRAAAGLDLEILDLAVSVVLSPAFDSGGASSLFFLPSRDDVLTDVFAFYYEHESTIRRTAADLGAAILEASGLDNIDLDRVLAQASAPPSFEEFLLGAIARYPLFSIDSVTVLDDGDYTVRIVVAYEDAVPGNRVMCGLGVHTTLVGADVEGSGTVVLATRFAFPRILQGVDDDFQPVYGRPETARYRCSSTYGMLGSGTVSRGDATLGGGPTATPWPDTPDGASLDTPSVTVDGSRLVVRVRYDNPGLRPLELECHFSGPAFSGPGGYGRKAVSVNGSGTATIEFDLGGEAQAGEYDVTCVLNGDISRSSRLVATPAPPPDYGIYSLEHITEITKSRLGLVVGSGAEIDARKLCTFSGGHLCSSENGSRTVAEWGGAVLMLGPFSTRKEAEQAYCDNMDLDTWSGGGSLGAPSAVFAFDGQRHYTHNGPACR
jgi:hypothetical protein